MNLQLHTRQRGPRVVGLTALIDVVFILLLFFMLTARLSPPAGIAVALGDPLARADDAGHAWGAPGDPTDRLVIGPAGLWLNDAPIDWGTLAQMATADDPRRREPIVLAPLASTPLQTVLDARDRLLALGWPAAALTLQLTQPGANR